MPKDPRHMPHRTSAEQTIINVQSNESELSDESTPVAYMLVDREAEAVTSAGAAVVGSDESTTKMSSGMLSVGVNEGYEVGDACGFMVDGSVVGSIEGFDVGSMVDGSVGSAVGDDDGSVARDGLNNIKRVRLCLICG